MVSMEWFLDVLESVRQFLPTLLAAVALMVVGWILAQLLRLVTRRIMMRLMDRTRRVGAIEAAVQGTGIRTAVPRIVGSFVFWVVFLLFVAAAIEATGLTVVTSVLSEVAHYLPNVLAGLVLLGVGVAAGRLVRRAVTAGATRAGFARADGVAQVMQAAVVLVAVVIGLEQIGIDAQLLVMLLTVTIGATFASAALAFGIGANTAVSNIIASHYVQQTYRAGQTVRIGDLEGEILQTTATAVILSTARGRMSIPARRFSEDPSLLLIPEA